jgi:hypothetical protein
MTQKIFAITISMVMSAIALSVNAQNVKNVKVSDNTVQVSYNDGSKTGFSERNSADLSFEENLAISKGERKAYNVRHTGLNGRPLKCTTLYGLGGVSLVNKNVAPQGNLGISHSFTPSIDLGLQVGYSRAQYDDEAVANGWYDTVDMMAVAKVAVYQSDKRKYAGEGFAFLAGLEAGAAFQKTDDLGLEKISGSQGYGFAGAAFLEAQVSVGKNFYLVGKVGAKMLPQFDLDQLKSGEEKLAENIAPFFQIGGAYRF